MTTYALDKVRFTNSTQDANSCSVLNIEENETATTIKKMHFCHINHKNKYKKWGYFFIKLTWYLFQSFHHFPLF